MVEDHGDQRAQLGVFTSNEVASFKRKLTCSSSEYEAENEGVDIVPHSTSEEVQLCHASSKKKSLSVRSLLAGLVFLYSLPPKQITSPRLFSAPPWLMEDSIKLLLRRRKTIEERLQRSGTETCSEEKIDVVKEL